MFKRLTLALCVFLSSAFADQPNLIEPWERSLNVLDVDLISRNQKEGEFVIADIHLVKWLNVPEQMVNMDSVLGLTKDGALVQVVFFQGRKIARILSGERHLHAFVISEDGLLLATDRFGNVLAFDHSKWVKSPTPSFLKSGLNLWTATTLAIGSYAYILYEMIPAEPQHALFLATTIGGSIVSALSTSLMTLSQYSESNKATDGFYLIGQLQPGQSLAEYTIDATRSGSLSTATGGLKVGCQSSFLPRPPGVSNRRISL